MLYGTYCKESVLIPAHTGAGRVWALAVLYFQRNVDVAQWGAVGRNVSLLKLLTELCSSSYPFRGYFNPEALNLHLHSF